MSTENQPRHQRTRTPARRSPSKRPSTIALVLSTVALIPIVLIVSLGIGATVQLWTNPGSSLGWKLFFPTVTAVGPIAAALAAQRQRQRGWSPTACTLVAEGVLLLAGLVLAYACTTAPN